MLIYVQDFRERNTKILFRVCRSNSAIIIRNFNELKVFLKFIENFVILLVESLILVILIFYCCCNHNVTIIIFGITIFLVGILESSQN